MATIGSPQCLDKHRIAAVQLSGRLQNYWSTDINWGLYPTVLTEVNIVFGIDSIGCVMTT